MSCAEAAACAADAHPVHVLVDAHVCDPRGRGMSHYASRFIEGLARNPSEFQFTILTRFPELLPSAPHLRLRKIPDVPAPVWEQALLPLLVRRLRPRIFHALANTVPLYRPTGVSTVVTLHDVIFMHPDPEISAGETITQKIGRAYRSWVCKRTIPGCERVLTISQHSRREIEARFPGNVGRIEVAYQGPSLSSRSRGRSAPREPYALLPGGNHSRKNVRRAIEAFVRFKRETDAPWRLLVSGVGPAQVDLRGIAGAGEVERAVQLLGYVPEADLPGLFEAAELIFFPSLEEGFGLPVLDALSLGRPVVTSNVSALPEIGGDAAVYVDPRSVAAMSGALVRLYRDPELRGTLSRRAQIQAKKFQWEDVTSKTLAVYRAVACEAIAAG